VVEPTDAIGWSAVVGRARLLIPSLFAMLAFKNLNDREVAAIAQNDTSGTVYDAKTVFSNDVVGL
jgi:hypothetical protein